MLLVRQLLGSTLHRMPFYAVAKGRQVGIYKTWPECQQQVNGFSGPRFKKFATESEAKAFIAQNSGGSTQGGGLVAAKSNWGRVGGKRSASSSSWDTSSAQQPAKKQAKKTIILDGDEVPKQQKQKHQPATKMARYGQHNFHQDDDGYVHVYTDGSCEGNGRSDAAAGLGVYFGEGHALNTAKPVSGRATNNCGEIQAATEAIRRAKEQGVERLTINTDSKFLIDSATKWVQGWKQRNWTLASGGAVKNKTDFQELDREMNSGGMQVKWNHVDAHRGIHGNERADQLAREGTQMYREKMRKPR